MGLDYRVCSFHVGWYRVSVSVQIIMSVCVVVFLHLLSLSFPKFDSLQGPV